MSERVRITVLVENSVHRHSLMAEERIQKTIARLRTVNLHCLAPVHCTGWPATARLWHAFPGICRVAGVGSVFEF